ncbi:MAG: hypothetical protein HFG76_01355 [Hungatella sp.]|nr:hypothetical protein [Hungatella sp.]
MEMATDQEYDDMMEELAYIRRLGRSFARLPDRKLRVSDEDAGDMEYANECLGITLQGLGVKMESSIPSGWEEFSAAERYRWCMGLASKQAGRLLWGLRLGLIKRYRVSHNDRGNVDTAESFLRDLASCKVGRKGGGVCLQIRIRVRFRRMTITIWPMSWKKIRKGLRHLRRYPQLFMYWIITNLW